MFRRRSTLRQLSDELRALEVFDRIHDLASPANQANDNAYPARRVRLNEIRAEIERLNALRPEQRNSARLGGAVALVCSVGWALFYYLLR